MITHEGTPQVAANDQMAPTCCHYWIIETASGPISRGECQICHEVRDFRNSVFDMDRDSQDNRSRKTVEPEAEAPQAVAPEMLQEPDQQEEAEQLGMEEPDAEEPDAEEPDTEEPMLQEPEFAGVVEE